MDIFNYVILLLIFSIIVFVTLFVDYKKNIKKTGIVLALVCLIVCAIIFWFYVRDIYFSPITSEGKAITFIMRTFMLDDNLLDGKNITTGFITLSAQMVYCFAFLSYFIIKYIICKTYVKTN